MLLVRNIPYLVKKCLYYPAVEPATSRHESAIAYLVANMRSASQVRTRAVICSEIRASARQVTNPPAFFWSNSPGAGCDTNHRAGQFKHVALRSTKLSGLVVAAIWGERKEGVGTFLKSIERLRNVFGAMV